MIYLSRISRFLKIVVLGIILGPSIAHADIMDDYFTLQAQLDDSLLNLYGNQASSLSPKLVQKFYQQLRHPSAQQLANQILTDLNTSPLSAPTLGQIQANLQHILALEMIQAQRQGDIPTAQQYRALIKLPKYANATEGALSLKRMGKQTSHQDTLSQLLAKEYLTWQTTRI